ncbi:MAG: hypothetical protein ACRDY3_08270 [Acidimicrobiales bacterium]
MLADGGCGQIVDLTDAAVGVPGDMAALLALGPDALDAAATAARSGARRRGIDEAWLLAPVPAPPKMLATGMNYRAHAAKMGR